MNAEQRSAIRTQFSSSQELLLSVFQDEHEENSFKRCVDIKEMADRL